MIRRFYVHNFRCLENFELSLSGQSSVLLIGENGSGKTTVGRAFRILQRIARGRNRVSGLVSSNDFAFGRTNLPMRFEIEVDIRAKVYSYSIALEIPEGLKAPCILEETLAADGKTVYTREGPEVSSAKPDLDAEGRLLMDRHLAALPIIREATKGPLYTFKNWLARSLILWPLPSLIRGDSDKVTLRPMPDMSNFGEWFSGLLAEAPSAYTKIDEYLKQMMPDLKEIKNPVIGTEVRSLLIHFSEDEGSFTVRFRDLSDGEKCFMICALVLAANDAYGPLFCFWDEPDNYLGLSEVGHFVMALRRAFQSGGQLIATSHNPEAIRRFSDQNTLLLHRKSHLEPTTVRTVEELRTSKDVTGDLVDALVRGDVEP